MAPKFRRSRVSVMYRFLIVVCSSDLKWGKRVVETVTVAEAILFSFHKIFRKRRFTVLHYNCKKNCETTHTVGELAFIAATNSRCFKFAQSIWNISINSSRFSPSENVDCTFRYHLLFRNLEFWTSLIEWDYIVI